MARVRFLGLFASPALVANAGEEHEIDDALALSLKKADAIELLQSQEIELPLPSPRQSRRRQFGNKLKALIEQSSSDDQ